MPFAVDLVPREMLTEEMRRGLKLIDRHLADVENCLASMPFIDEALRRRTMAELNEPRLKAWAEFSAMIRAARARLGVE